MSQLMVAWSAQTLNIIKAHIAANPGMALVQIGAIGISLCTSLVTAPILRLLGFGALGPAPGSLAAWWQSTWGVSAVFSILQSGAMLGYGAVIIDSAVKAIALGGAALAGLASYFR
ncbi:hypothetical protein AMS68_000158 [Peltaster fructicola]|uniref:Uncharacterized protein n=1 Tax=Peltaster fructicola TaxID=286661 RepID=A0A6H0XJ29_9PEZI|nr:hypothetical protein AMS68_000158 [Peltaster fructicola]